MKVWFVELRSDREKLYIFRKGLVQGIPDPNHLVYDILGSAHIAYSAGQKIDMPIGFEVSNGAQIEAFIDGCTLSGSTTSQHAASKN